MMKSQIGRQVLCAHESRREDVIRRVLAFAVGDQALHVVAQAVFCALARADAVQILLLGAPEAHKRVYAELFEVGVLLGPRGLHEVQHLAETRRWDVGRGVQGVFDVFPGRQAHVQHPFDARARVPGRAEPREHVDLAPLAAREDHEAQVCQLARHSFADAVEWREDWPGMRALCQRIPAAAAHVDFEQLALLLLGVRLEDQRRVAGAQHIGLPDVLREARLERSGLPALERSLLGVARGADGLEKLRLSAHRLPQRRGVVPAQIAVEDASAESAAAVLLFEDALPLRLCRAAALCLQ